MLSPGDLHAPTDRSHCTIHRAQQRCTGGGDAQNTREGATEARQAAGPSEGSTAFKELIEDYV